MKPRNDTNGKGGSDGGSAAEEDGDYELVGVSVYAKIVVKELMEMSVKEETLKVLAWIRMYWIDPRYNNYYLNTCTIMSPKKSNFCLEEN